MSEIYAEFQLSRNQCPCFSPNCFIRVLQDVQILHIEICCYENNAIEISLK